IQRDRRSRDGAGGDARDGSQRSPQARTRSATGNSRSTLETRTSGSRPAREKDGGHTGREPDVYERQNLQLFDLRSAQRQRDVGWDFEAFGVRGLRGLFTFCVSVVLPSTVRNDARCWYFLSPKPLTCIRSEVFLKRPCSRR